MAVLTAFIPKEKKYKVAGSVEDASSMSDCDDNGYCRVDHHPPHLLPRRSKTSCVVVVVLVVSLLLNAAIAVYICTVRNRDPRPPPPHAERLMSAVHGDSLCTGCTTLGLDVDPDRSIEYPHLTVHRLEDGSSLCCMQDAGSLKTLAQIFADLSVLTSNQNTTHQSADQQTIGAHLYADSDALKRHPPSLAWSDEYGFGSAYINDVIRHDNQLVVTKPGLYHVYSFFTFKTLQQRVSPDNILHTVYRQNRNLPRIGSHVMLMDKRTLPEASERFETSFLSATVRLRQDDQVYVKVSNLSYVYPFSPSNFFGLFFLGE